LKRFSVFELDHPLELLSARKVVVEPDRCAVWPDPTVDAVPVLAVIQADVDALRELLDSQAKLAVVELPEMRPLPFGPANARRWISMNVIQRRCRACVGHQGGEFVYLPNNV
jgi:hypothetical protein